MVRTPTLPGTEKISRAHKGGPKPKAIMGPPALTRVPITFLTPGQLDAKRWRTLIAGAPIVKACIQTQVMQVTGLSWFIEGEDEDAKAYFTKVLEHGDGGEGWEVMISRVVKDTMEVPFGGAVEIGAFRDGVVAWLHHIDGATMVPTYNETRPFAQIDPFGGLRPVSFTANQIGRVRWQAQTDLRAYDWTITPTADCLPAIQALIRADRFWQSFLLDNPPSGILDIPGFSEAEATSWYESWQEMMAGIDAFKVPILYGRERDEGKAAQARFIEFAKSPAETKMLELIKSYAEVVTACFGMTLGDLGLFGQELRLAGATKLMELSKRQGLAKLMRSTKGMIDNDVLPDGLEFQWEEMDLEDDLRKAQTKKFRGETINAFVTSQTLTPRQALRVAVQEGILPADAFSEEELVDQEGGGPEPETPPEDVEVTDEELGPEDAPSAQAVAEDLEERAYHPFQQRYLQDRGAADRAFAVPASAFPTSSPWAKKMALLTERLLAPARRASKARLGELLSIGLTAFQEGAAATDVQQRSVADAKAALDTALRRTDWWKSPQLVDEVFDIMRGAYDEGGTDAIKAIEGERVKLGLAAVDLSTTTFQVTNNAVLDQIRARAGQFITHIDNGTRTFITNSVMTGVREGISSPSIARKLLVDQAQRDLIQTFKGRSLSIVNTEINWAESQAALLEQKQMGLRQKKWENVPALSDPICSRNAGRGFVDVDADFESVFGSIQAPPAHPGVCHCWITFSKDELRSLGDDVNYWLGA